MSRTLASKVFPSAALSAVLVGMCVAASPAQASLEVQLQSGGQTWSQTGDSPLIVARSIGDFSFTGDIGQSGPAPSLDLVSANLSSGFDGGTLVITLSENDLTTPVGLSSWLTQLSDSFSLGNVSMTLASYVDNSNTLLGTGTQLTT